MDAREAVRSQLAQWHEAIGAILADCSPELVNRRLSGSTIGSIGTIYAHTVFSEDGIVNGMFLGQPPLYYRDGWNTKLSVQMPANPAQDFERDLHLEMDVPSFSEYAKSVFANTEDFISKITDEQLQQTINSPFGAFPGAFFAFNVLGTHLPGHASEIAALKGIAGLKGLPF